FRHVLDLEAAVLEGLLEPVGEVHWGRSILVGGLGAAPPLGSGPCPPPIPLDRFVHVNLNFQDSFRLWVDSILCPAQYGAVWNSRSSYQPLWRRTCLAWTAQHCGAGRTRHCQRTNARSPR